MKHAFFPALRSCSRLKSAGTAMLAWAIALALAMTQGPARAVEVAADYQAGIAGNPAVAPSPATQGWTAVVPTADTGNFISAPVSPDGASGLNAWRMLDNSTTASQFQYWTKAFTATQITNAMTNGWRMLAHMRMVDPVAGNAGANAVYMFFGNNAAKRWIIFFDINASGVMVATFSGGSTLTLTGVDPALYHTHEMVYSPATQTVEYLVDGSSKLAGYTGTTGAANGPRFGTESSGGKGDGYWNRVSLVINDPPPPPVPEATTQPASQSVAEGGNATLTAVFSGSPTSYQWYKDTVALPGATSANLSLANLTAADAGDYWCRATNAAGSGSSRTAALEVLSDSGGLVISEMVAENDSGPRDVDGERQDWLEIHNTSTAAIGTGGYKLTDAAAIPGKWPLPAVSLLPGASLMVWASGKDRRVAGSELHTNFSLSNASNRYLALVKPDGSIATAFTYPEQFADNSYGLTVHRPARVKYFTLATPGALNVDGQTSVKDGLDFSPGPGAFTGSVAVNALGRNILGSTARYTTNGRLPEFDSSVFPTVLTLTASARLRVANIFPGERYGATASGGWLKLGADVAAFTSPLPVLILSNHGAGTVPGVSSRGPNGDGSSVAAVAMQTHSLLLLDAATGDTALTSPVLHSSRAGLKLRGSSSFSFSEKSYALETWGERDDLGRDVALAGMPADSDWVIYGPDPAQFDNTLIHNTVAYELARSTGFNAPRYRFVELFLDSGDDLTMADHRGLAILMEKPSRGKDRVDFNYPSKDATSGGWMLKVDRMDATTAAVPTPRHFHTAGPDGILQAPDDNPRGYQAIAIPGGAGSGSGILPANDDMPNNYNSFFNFDSPSAADLTATQRGVIQTTVRNFDAALYGPNYLDPVSGYWPHIDAPNWAQHLLLHCFTKNLDAVLLSCRLYRKSPTSPIRWTAFWDADRAFDKNTTNAVANQTLNWAHDRLFYRRMVTDPEFMQVYVDQWQNFRRGPWANAALTALVDGQAAQITSAVAARSGLTATAWNTNVTTMRTWLLDRAAAMDTQFTAPATLSLAAGNVAAGSSVSLAAPVGVIYYTLNGSDPRLRGGASAPAATVFGAAIPIAGPTTVTARVLNAGNWSGLTTATYFPPQDLTKLRVTEIYYHPTPQSTPFVDGDQFEFLELKNTSATPLDLGGLSFTTGIDYTFPVNTTLAPGALWVLVGNATAFASRFPGCASQGVFADKMANSGETLTLSQGGITVWSVTYDDLFPWPMEADGHGASLQRPDPAAPGYNPATWAAAPPSPCQDMSLADTDHDGMADYWEPQFGLTVGLADGAEDSDNDGATNAEEYTAGTDPTDPADRLLLAKTTFTPTQTTLEFTAVAGKSYTVQVSGDLGAWQPLQQIPAGADTRVVQVSDATTPSRRFYRAVTPAAP